jgi:hypothetical protein
MVRGLFSFIVGLYAGVYFSQNYDPQALFEKIKDFADRHRKP